MRWRPTIFSPTRKCLWASFVLSICIYPSGVVSPFLDINGFAYDHSPKVSFKVSSKDELHIIRNPENCTKDVKVWMDKIA